MKMKGGSVEYGWENMVVLMAEGMDVRWKIFYTRCPHLVFGAFCSSFFVGSTFCYGPLMMGPILIGVGF